MLHRTRTIRLPRSAGRGLSLWLGGLLVVSHAAWAPAQAIRLPEGFAEEVVLRNLVAPTAFARASDGRVFVAEKSGLIKVFENLTSNTAVVFADLRTQVFNAEDAGLMGIALHPRFPGTPYVYVAYAFDAPRGGTAPLWGNPGETFDPCPASQAGGCPVSGRLSRLEASGNSQVGNEVVLLENWCHQFLSHSLGGLVFDSAGRLYVSAGDAADFSDVDYGQRGSPPNACGDPATAVGVAPTLPTARGGALRSQNIDRAGFNSAAFGGKILRIDPISGNALPDNPLFGSAVPNADRIIARGLRQPFRVAIRPGTDELWLGDVGWGEWEEINRIENPAASVVNFGWPCFEGPDRQAAYSALGLDACEELYSDPSQHHPPYFSYSHFEAVAPGDGCGSGTSAITGLAFYQGPTFPSRYAGALFFADYARRCIWAMLAGAGGLPDAGTPVAFASDAASPIDLQIGADGSLLYLDVVGGTLRRISYVAGNRSPTAVLNAAPVSGPAPLEVRFDGSASYDPEGDALTFHWDFNEDGTADATGAMPRHTFHQPGEFSVTLEVRDGRGGRAETQVEIRAGEALPPAAQILTPRADLLWQVGDEIFFSGTATVAGGGALPPEAFSWSLILHHCRISSCHVHPLQTFAGIESGTFVTVNHGYPTHLELELTVTDARGLSDTQSLLLYPETGELIVASEPPGLQLAAGVETQTTPYSQTVLARSSLTVTAPSPQEIGCRHYGFVDWSDGGGRSHEIEVPPEGVQLRARFELLSDMVCTRCAGDCDGDGVVRVDEIVKTVSIAIGVVEMSSCPDADLNEDGAVTVDEILSAVTNALDQCGAGAP